MRQKWDCFQDVALNEMDSQFEKEIQSIMAFKTEEEYQLSLGPQSSMQ